MIEAGGAPPAIAACVERARRLLEREVASASQRRATAFDPIRGLYVTEAEVDDILARAAVPESCAPDAAAWTMPQLARFPLDAALHDAVALAVAAEYVPRLDRVFGFLHDDLTRRALTAGLLVEMLGLDPHLLTPEALAMRLALLTLGAHDVPLAASVRVDAGFLATLAGDHRLDARIRAVARVIAVPAASGANGSARPAPPAPPLVLWGAARDELHEAALERCAAAGGGAVHLAADGVTEALGIAAREAIVRGAMLVVAVADPAQARAVAHSVAELPVCALIEAPGGIVGYDGPAARVTRTRTRAAQDSTPAGYPLPYGRRAIARRTTADLILPPAQLRAIRSIHDRMRMRDLVTRQWAVDTGSSFGGVRALFAGPPGTGKTLAAEALAHALERDLYIIDVSLVVSKYIGETEKALATVFGEASRAGVCLFFDEADALFGKRTETSDAHDRYANIETAYLLQALDVYPDIAILATNMAANIDDALVRRIDVKVEFPMPDTAARERLWQRALGRAPLAGVDVAELARRLPLSGGGIQSAALAAAFAAAADERAIVTLDLLRAARDELAKTGRIAGRLELGEYEAALRSEERA